jgi:hypothetical protein
MAKAVPKIGSSKKMCICINIFVEFYYLLVTCYICIKKLLFIEYRALFLVSPRAPKTSGPALAIPIPATSGERNCCKLEKTCASSRQVLLLCRVQTSTLATRHKIVLPRLLTKFLFFPILFLAFGKDIMNTLEQPYIENKQGLREWDYLASVVDGDAVVDAEQ